MYDHIHASVQINGTPVAPVAICSGIRQGCPLSMCPYALCLHPLVQSLEESLPGIQVVRRTLKTTVISYADDITIFDTDPTFFPRIRHAISTYKQAIGAGLNLLNSNTLAIAGWTDPKIPLDIPFRDRVEILGITFDPTVAFSRVDSWARIIREVRAQARKLFTRTLCLEQCVKICLLAKISFTAQILLPTQTHVQQLTSTCAWYIWQVSISRVPVRRSSASNTREDGICLT